MAKYSYEFKKKVVASYLNGEVSQGDLMKKYNIPTKSDIQNWIANYKAFGDEGLVCSKENQKYTFEYKMYVVELYLSEE
ncbi:MAG: helix-turn-helix domain-containing protein, partial [Clostridia bacterium]|nr:helix-turn-helix domain-containing protein [Clostridia bacterium]